MDLPLITACLIVSAIWSILCRLRHMAPDKTRPCVVLQHAALAMALFAALVLPPAWMPALLAAGIVAFLLGGASRWRHAAPPGTCKVPPMNEVDTVGGIDG